MSSHHLHLSTSGKNLLKSFEEEETPNKPQDENAINTSPPKTPNMSDVQEKGDEDNTPDITKLMQENKILNPEELPGDEKADKDDEEDKNIKNKNVAEEEKRDKKLSKACLSPYLRRQVVIHEKRTNPENNLSTYIFIGISDYEYVHFSQNKTPNFQFITFT